jgi:hypothetical protein
VEKFPPPWLGWRRRHGREGASGGSERGRGRGGVAGELDAAVGPAEARGAAAPHARHARSGTQFRDRNIFPFYKLQT